ncbi:MAG: 2-oxoacid:acceptor oxidoreductase family protein [Chloroflexota bacterium]
METSIVIAGFGGQGVLFAGQLLAYAGMDAGKHVTWIPSYGPEMRGGTAHCVVIISDDPIGAPVVAQPDIAIALNQPSFEKYLPLVKSGGLLVVNSSLVEPANERPDIDIVMVPANAIAEEWGTVKMLNMAVVGAMLAGRPVLSMETIEKALRDHIGSKREHLIDENLAVLHHGYEVRQFVNS